MKDLTSKAGLSEQFEIASAATSAWEIGNPVYPPARQKLAEHGIDCNGKTARQMTRLDYARYDHLIGMDESNLCDILRLVGGDPQHKVSLLMAHTAPVRSMLRCTNTKADEPQQNVAMPWKLLRHSRNGRNRESPHRRSQSITSKASFCSAPVARAASNSMHEYRPCIAGADHRCASAQKLDAIAEGQPT